MAKATSVNIRSMFVLRMRYAQDGSLAEGRREPTWPGMRVEMDIKTGERRGIAYLLSSVMEAVQEAGRER